MLALAFRVQQSTDADPEIPNKDVYETYQHICEQENSDPLKQRRVRDLLNELEFLGIIKQDRRGRGRGKGGYTVNHLVDEPELVLRACKEDSSPT